MKRMLMILLTVCMLFGCTGTANKPVSQEPENMAVKYTQLKEDNVFYSGTKDSLKSLLEHGTGIIYLGFPECPWCQAYAPKLNEAVAEADTKVLYYNIYTDKTENPEYYDEIASYINEQDDSILSYNNDGRLVIYMPLVLFVKGGEIIGFDHETCTEDASVISPEEYWTDERNEALHTKLFALADEISFAQAQNDSQGCSLECAQADN